MKRLLTRCGLVLVMMAVATVVQAQSYRIGGKTYVPTGSPEIVAANFNPADGGVSSGSYSGLVRLVVSGSGVSCTPATNDAFYIYVWLPGCGNPSTVPQHDANWYQLTFDSQTLVGLNPSRDATRFIFYDIDAGVEVLSRPYVPAYRTDHTYSFIVDTGLVSAAPLHFGVSDGGFSDNTGAYQVQITQLVVPTPFDFTGDLKADILWRHTGWGDVWLWPMNGAARTAETYVRTVADTNFEIRGVADFDGNGSADIVWRNKVNGQIYIWPMNGTTPASETYVGTVNPAYDIVGTGDYDGNGKADLLWRHLVNGELWFWSMNGTTPYSQEYVATVDPGYEVVGSGDLNGDGLCDAVWRHKTTGEVWAWIVSDTGPPAEVWVATVPDTGYLIVGVADFTGDSKADVLWHHATSGQVWMWTMNGATRVSQTWVDTVPETAYRIVGTGDYNGDGKADILWHHATLGEVWVWLMNGTARLSQAWVSNVPDVGYQIAKVK